MGTESVEFEKVPALFERLRFLTASPQILQEIADVAHIGSTGSLSFDDFWRLLQHFCKQCGLSAADIMCIRSHFIESDVDKSGGINVSELRYFMRQMGFPATHERLQQIQEEFDADGSGELEFDELLRVVSRYREKEVQMVRAFLKKNGNQCDNDVQSSSTEQLVQKTPTTIYLGDQVRSSRLRCEPAFFDMVVGDG